MKDTNLSRIKIMNGERRVYSLSNAQAGIEHELREYPSGMRCTSGWHSTKINKLICTHRAALTIPDMLTDVYGCSRF